MFQSFDVVSDPSVGPPRIKMVRALMEKRRVDALLVPRADEFQGEYVPANAERLQWLSGFTGSAGMAVVTAKAAALVTDGRYTVQAQAQVHTRTFDVVDSSGKPWIDWLARKLPEGGVLGYDPRLHTWQSIEALKSDAAKRKITIKALPVNLIDLAWGKDRPMPPAGAVSVQPKRLAGVAPETKIAELQARLVQDKQAAVVLTLPDSVSWLFNIRGCDVSHNPVVLAFAVVPAKGKPEIFIDTGKLSAESSKHLTSLAAISQPSAIVQRLKAMRSTKGEAVRVDPATASAWIVKALGANAFHASDPCILPKACKTKAELDGARAAHRRDGAAMVRFLAWLDAAALDNSLDEIGVATKLEQFRVATGALKDISFATIAGSGPNGALPHYRVTTASNRQLRQGELIVIDSGGQYQDGTTDITRTVAIGTPDAEMRTRFTQVLKGHIGVATARFPVGTRGIQLDTLARKALWNAGLDFDHGTGHGVGSFLSVHEGPQSISKRGMAELCPGMIVSNEPGYYKPGAYGIRIENLEVVTDARPIVGGERPMLGFECLTLAPIDQRCIDVSLLTVDELQWLDAYHARVAEMIGPELDASEQKWLAAATRPARVRMR